MTRLLEVLLPYKTTNYAMPCLSLPDSRLLASGGFETPVIACLESPGETR